MMTVEELAEALYEAERDAVEKGLTFLAMPTKWVPWHEVVERVRAGRRLQAAAMHRDFVITPRRERGL